MTEINIEKIKELLKEGFDSIIEDEVKPLIEGSKEDIEKYGAVITEEFAKYLEQAAAGSEEAKENIEHLVIQLQGLAIKQMIQVSEAAWSIIETTAKVIAKMLPLLLVAI